MLQRTKIISVACANKAFQNFSNLSLCDSGNLWKSSRQHIFVYQTGSCSNPPQSDNVGQSGASPNPADHGDNGSLSTVARLAE
ncbi:hypothetical protein RRG08_011942 [Elysia crispata]|uniref:Uncharacterized protein n=1 Tax=Elysia crispata TaxID=231223 RepID=A0AAE0XY75_9GAST|nr:hypothetical protein RRG08_011942 [Elysia crispata]